MFMKKEDVALAAQILTSMKDAAARLEKALKKDDKEEIEIAKKNILEMQKNLAKII